MATEKVLELSVGFFRSNKWHLPQDSNLRLGKESTVPDSGVTSLYHA
jgi:hypothetical protein